MELGVFRGGASLEYGVEARPGAKRGTSSAAAFARLIGLMYGAGRILVGGAPVRAGTLLSRLGTGPPRAVAIPSPISIASSYAAARATQPCRIDLITSELDDSLDATLEFAESARPNPVLRCNVHVEDYGRHAEVADTFYRLLRTLPAPRRVATPSQAPRA